MEPIESYPKEMSLRFGLAKYYQAVANTDSGKSVYKKIIDIDGDWSGWDASAKAAWQSCCVSENKGEEASRLIAEVLEG